MLPSVDIYHVEELRSEWDVVCAVRNDIDRTVEFQSDSHPSTDSN